MHYDANRLFYFIMEKEFVSYEQAVALKELGFDEECIKYYYKEYELFVVSDYYDGGHFVTAPLKQQVFRWFRKKYGIHHVINWVFDKWEWSTEGNEKYFGYTETYEEAEDACIDKLIELSEQY